ncbi:MarR family winged helix-turn-helix transcriptional regulator [Acidobacterium sp. S8]|uniref:MarR family winged helix-turn-helix transcriptional regulator n=1 Tax=Acidobacterium sp. S8 TaxID=1641854 RepID=UPI00131CD7D5|nr:MarR family transcriptional regulator [Acidobacterium sp. S8]
MKTDEKRNSDGIHLWLVLWKAFRSVEAHAHRHISEFGLGLSDFGVLEVLMHKGPQTVKELGAKVMLTSGSMTAALDRLERRDLIERTGDKGDRRVRVIKLTRAGAALIRESFEDHKQAMEEAVAGIGEEDRRVAIDLLRRIGLHAVAQLESADKNVAVKNGRKK